MANIIDFKVKNGLLVATTATIEGATNSTSTGTGSLQVRGGAGIHKDLWVGGTIYNKGNPVIDTGNLSSYGVTILNAGTDTAVNTSTGVVTVWNISTLQSVTTRGSTTDQAISITNSTESTSTSTGALKVVGGIGVGRDIWVGQRLNVGSNAIVTGDVAVNGGDLITDKNTFNLINTTATVVNFAGAGTAITIGAATGSTTIRNATTVSNSTNASSTSTGALVVYGGVGINQDLRVGGVIYGSVSGASLNTENVKTVSAATNTDYFLTFVPDNNATAAYEPLYTDTGIKYNPSTDSLTVSGNATITGDIAINGGDLTTTQSTFNLINATATTVNFASAGTAIIMGANSAGYVSVRNTSDASSVATGALRVAGGAGISGNLYVGGNTVVTGNLTIQGTTTIVDSTVTNVSDPIFTIGGGANGAAPTTDDSKDRGIAFQWHNGTNARIGFFGFDDSTGFFTFISSATITNEVVAPAAGTTRGAIDANLAGGSAMSIVYQSAADTTTFLAAGTAGYLLKTNGVGSAPSWADPGGLSVASAGKWTTARTITLAGDLGGSVSFDGSSNFTLTATIQANSVALGTDTTGNYVASGATSGFGLSGSASSEGATFTVSSNATSSNVVSTIVYRDTSGNFSANSISANSFVGPITGSASQVNTVRNSTNAVHYLTFVDANNASSSAETLYTTASVTVNPGTGEVDITSTLASTSTTTGALVVTGGVGIGKDAWVGGGLYATTKSFLIDHPTKSGMKLRYGSLESPYHGVRLTGEAEIFGNEVRIQLPEYISALCKTEGSQVQITNIRHGKVLWIESVDVDSNSFVVAMKRTKSDKKSYGFYWSFTAIRKDIEDLEVEIGG